MSEEQNNLYGKLIQTAGVSAVVAFLFWQFMKFNHTEKMAAIGGADEVLMQHIEAQTKAIEAMREAAEDNRESMRVMALEVERISTTYHGD